MPPTLQPEFAFQSRRAEREGAALVLVLVAVATIVTLALGASALAAGRARRAEAALLRAALRDEARAALARAARSLCADTNGVDHLGEDWALASAEAAASLARGGDGVFATVEDDAARVAFPACGEPALARLLAEAARADEAEARGAARAAFLWKAERDAAAAQASAERGGAATNDVLAAEEELLAVPAADPALFAAALPLLTVHPATPALNPNTAPRETVVALALAAGAAREGAEGLWSRLERVRGRGGFFESTEQTEALKLLQGDGDAPTAEEIEALRLLRPLLRVSSDVFRLAAVARRGGVAVRVDCVWDRASRRILRWCE